MTMQFQTQNTGNMIGLNYLPFLLFEIHLCAPSWASWQTSLLVLKTEKTTVTEQV